MDFCEKIGTLSGSYDSARIGSEEIWGALKYSLLRITEDVCGWRKNIFKETWWWDDSVSKIVGEKKYL